MMQDYYTILGLKPGASAADIQKAFRERIKLCHPDRSGSSENAEQARRLIEAYNRLKEGIPVEIHGHGPRSGVDRNGNGPTKEERSRYYSGPGRSGETIFRSVFQENISDFLNRFRSASGGGTPYRSRFRESHPEFYPRKNGVDTPYRKEDVFTGFPEEDPVSGASPRAREAYRAAEGFLRKVVQKYKRQSHRPRRQWARDYIRDLNLVQIKFRDVASGHPGIYTAAMKRLRQVQELSEEVRKIMHA